MFAGSMRQVARWTCALAFSAHEARADELADARRLAAALDYERALSIVEHALAHGGNDPARVVDLHELAGELAAGLGREREAEDHYAAALELRPDLVQPDTLSPRLRAPFDTARARKLPPLQLHVDVLPGLARVAIDVDSLGLVVGIAVDVVTAAGAHAERTTRESTRIALAPGDTAVEVTALDAAGNRVWISPVAASSAPTPAPAIPARVDSAPHASRPWWASWATWAVACAATGATGAVFAWREQVAQDDWNALRAQDGQHNYSQLTAVASRGNTYAVAADVGFALAATTGIAAAVLAITGPHTHAVTLVGSSRALGIGIAARF